MKSAVVVAAALACSTVAHAQPGASEPMPVPAARSTPVQVGHADEDVAAGLSLAGTVVSWGLLIAGGSMQNDSMMTAGAIGTLFGPSFGHWYADSIATRGLGIRALGVGVSFIGLVMAFGDALSEGSSNDEGTATTLLLVGIGMYVAGTVDDIATAPRAARRYNARFQNVNVVPQLNAHGGGLALVGRF